FGPRSERELVCGQSARPEPQERTMTIAYLTHDEVNAAAAGRIARRLGLGLSVIGVRDVGRVSADLLVYDLDHLPPGVKSELLRRAGRERLDGVAAHSYHLGHEEQQKLRAAGARVARRLTAAILVRRAAAAPGGCRSE